jgi:hypothetical protein
MPLAAGHSQGSSCTQRQHDELTLMATRMHQRGTSKARAPLVNTGGMLPGRPNPGAQRSPRAPENADTHTRAPKPCAPLPAITWHAVRCCKGFACLPVGTPAGGARYWDAFIAAGTGWRGQPAAQHPPRGRRVTPASALMQRARTPCTSRPSGLAGRHAVHSHSHPSFF